MRRLRPLVVASAVSLAVSSAALLSSLLVACDMPTPLAPAPPIGTFPTWGEGFATPKEQPQSALGAGPAPGMAAPGANAMSSTGTAMPGAVKSFSGGDVAVGKGVYQALCARCHGANGEGGALPGNINVPAFADAAVQGALTDAQMARSIALGKGAMPAFRDDLNRDQLAGVIAFIRTLKK